MATVVGVFESMEHAKKAIETLEEMGFSDEELSIVAKDNRSGDDDGDDELDSDSMDMLNADDMSDGAAWGGGIGAVGGILAGIGALAIPGIGPLVAAGPIAAGLSGAVAGGLAGGLIDLGIPDEEGGRFEQDVQEGRLLTVIQCEGDDVDRAETVLRRFGADEVQVYQ